MPDHFFRVQDYDLDATLASGQVFRWRKTGNVWTGVLGQHRYTLVQQRDGLAAGTQDSKPDWDELRFFLQLDVPLNLVLNTFPQDAPMEAAVNHCRGLRLLRQDPWECLASFILSSTKQIVQIQQVISALCERFGEPRWPDDTPHPLKLTHAFPGPERLAAATEESLRACKMGFRAPYLLGTARRVAEGSLDLAALHSLPLEQARQELLTLPGVGRKIADCVLLFAYGFPKAFPVDVWVMRGLRQLYFPRRRKMRLAELHTFSENHFGPNSGFAQQYLFHYMRTRGVKMS